MDKTKIEVEYTPEGFARAAASLEFLPEEQRTAMLSALVMSTGLL